jgi:hypothetical protein
MIASAIVVVGLLSLALLTLPRVRVSQSPYAHSRTKRVLTLDTGNGWVAGEYVAARIVRDHTSATGCWMRPIPDDVRVRWLSTAADTEPNSLDHDHYSMSDYKKQHIEFAKRVLTMRIS